MNNKRVVHILRVIGASFRIQIRDRATSNFFLATVFLQPVIFSLLAVGVYHYGNKPDMSMLGILGAGLVGIWNANLWTSGLIVNEERRLGTLEHLIAVPASFEWVLIGKSLSNSIASVISLGISLLTGVMVTNQWPRISSLGWFLTGLALSILALSGLGLILGNLFVLSRTTTHLTELLNYPIFILSGLSFPLTLIPLWTRPLSWLLAPMWGNMTMVQALGLSSSTDNPGYLMNGVMLVILTGVYFALGHRLYRLTEHRVRWEGKSNLF